MKLMNRGFLGRSVSQQKNLSDNTASIVDEEIRRIADCLSRRTKNVKEIF